MTNTAQHKYSKKQGLSGVIIEHTAKRMKQHLARLFMQLPKNDITVDQWVLLDIVDRQGPMNQNDLSTKSFKDAPTVTRILDLLVAKNLINRSPDSDDRRKFNIGLTEKGIKEVKRLRPIVEEFRAKSYNGITDQEIETLQAILHKINQNL